MFNWVQIAALSFCSDWIQLVRMTRMTVLIKDKLVDLIERIFQRECSLYIACNDRNAFFTSDAARN